MERTQPLLFTSCSASSLVCRKDGSQGKKVDATAQSSNNQSVAFDLQVCCVKMNVCLQV